MNTFFSQTLMMFCPLLIAALGGMVTEKGGVTNIALDGLMVFGSFVGIAIFKSMAPDYTASFTNSMIFLFALIIAMIAGMVIAAIHAYAAVHLKANEIVSATTINMFATALATFLAFLFVGNNTTHNIMFTATPFRMKIGKFIFYPSLFVGLIILISTWAVFKYTKYGFRLKAAGENPYALAAAGVNVEKYRISGVLISGALASAAGFIYLVTGPTEFTGSLGGIGFLALAMMIGGNWNE